MMHKYFTAPLADTSKKELIIVEFQCGRHRLCVLMDTGAPTSMIRKRSADRVGLPVHNKDNTDFVQLPDLSLGDFHWSDMCIAVDSQKDQSLLHHGVETDGVFGCDLMNDLCWIFEPPNGRFHLCTPDHPFLKQWSQGANSLPIHKHTLGDYPSNVWATHCFLNGHGPIHTDLDTGAQRTLLNTKAGAYLDPDSPREPIRLSNGGDIKNVSSYRTRADTLSIADVTFAQPLIAVCDPIFSVDPPLLEKPAVLLGSDLLGLYRYGFDFHGGTFWIHPKP